MTEKDVYKNGVALLEEWEDVNYCEHSFKFKDEWLTDKEVVDKLNELNDENNKLKNSLELSDVAYHEMIKSNKELHKELYQEFKKVKKENKELKEQLKDCPKKAKEEIRKQAENEAIRWANIGR